MVGHWTNEEKNGFAIAIIIDYLNQIEGYLDDSGLSRKDYAARLELDPSRVSQILNSPQKENPTVESLVRYARALGKKVSIVAYDDDDPHNDRGPVLSDIFVECWEQLGSPRDLSAFSFNLASDQQSVNSLKNEGSLSVMGSETKKTPQGVGRLSGNENSNAVGGL